MKKIIREILTRNIYAVAPDAPVSEAVGMMRSKLISCVLVLKDGRPVGMFTERNIVIQLARKGPGFMNVPIRDVMTSPVITVPEDTFLYEAFHIFTANKIRHLAVVGGDGRAAGVLTFSNVVGQVGHEFFIEFQPVSNVMSTVVYTVEKDHTLRQILPEMAERGISCVIHAVEGRPEGILSERDIARVAAMGRDLSGILVSDVMTSPVVTVPKSILVHDAARIMREKRLRRVVVVDEAGGIAGIVTQTDIVRGLESKYVKILKQVIQEKDLAIHQASSRLDEKAAYLDNILASSIDMGIVASDTDYRIMYFNPGAEWLLGVKAEDVVGRRVQDMHQLAGVAPERVADVERKIASGDAHTFSFERENGEGPRFIQARVSGIWDKAGVLSGYVCMFQDVTERKRAEENIRYMAYHDILTGLPNRVAFNERLKLELAHAERDGGKLAVMMADLDRFKDVNDTMGHYAGDLLLEAVAGRLQAGLRKSDTVARVGGDEFMVILPEVRSPEDAMLVAGKIVESMEPPFEVKGREVRVGFSLGVAVYPDHAGTGKALAKAADRAMYAAKSGNGGKTVCSAALFALEG